MKSPQEREMHAAWMEAANEKPIFLRIDGGSFPAKIAGYSLDWPVIYAGHVKCEINWHQVHLLAKGDIDTINYN